MSEKEKYYKANSVSQIFKRFISSVIPKKQTNILFMLFNGIDEAINAIEFKINAFKRESNILTAENVSSLRTLAAQNGFEPRMKIPAKGFVKMVINPKVFAQHGYPIYLPAYSVFRCKHNGLDYYYESDKMLRIDSSETLVPLVEGIMRNQQFVSTKETIQRFYLQSANIAEGSISVIAGGKKYHKVKSFFDNDGLWDNRQFMVKYSSDTMNPIILYIKGLRNNENINVTYKDTSGQYGNLPFKTLFECTEFLDKNSNPLSFDAGDILIQNISGFTLGSNGSSVNSLKAAIGFNHGLNLLFDKRSYEDYIEKYSTILLQGIVLSDEYKAIKHIYVSKKLYLNPEQEIGKRYRDVINKQEYFLGDEEIADLSEQMEQDEYALSSHYINHSKTQKYALQIGLNIGQMSEQLLNYHKGAISDMIYTEFSKFFYNKFHQISFELLLNDYTKKHNIDINYILFVDNGEVITTDAVTIKHIDKLPILKGDFAIKGSNQIVNLFEDINFVIKK